MTRRTAWIVIILSWSCECSLYVYRTIVLLLFTIFLNIFPGPILMLLVYYSSISNQGYLSPDCSNNHFMKRWTYRVFYASCFFAPLVRNEMRQRFLEYSVIRLFNNFSFFTVLAISDLHSHFSHRPKSSN